MLDTNAREAPIACEKASSLTSTPKKSSKTATLTSAFSSRRFGISSESFASDVLCAPALRTPSSSASCATIDHSAITLNDYARTQSLLGLSPALERSGATSIRVRPRTKVNPGKV